MTKHMLAHVNLSVTSKTQRMCFRNMC